MKCSRHIAVLCAAVTLAAQVHADALSDALATAVSEVSSDSGLISKWSTDQLRYAIPFNSTTGAVEPDQLKILGIELGVEGNVSSTKVDVNAFRALPTQLVNVQTVDVATRLPLPSIIGHAHVGLPFGLDGGVRFGGIPSKSFDNGDTHVTIQNSIFGLDLRKKLMDDTLMAPFGMTLGLNYTHATGHVDATTPYSGNQTVSSNGTPFDVSFDGNGDSHSEWNTNSMGLQLIFNKKVAIVNPYFGASINRNWGSVSNTLTTGGSMTGTDDSDSSITDTQDISAVGAQSEEPNKWDARALVGVELSILPFIRLGIGGEYAGSRNVAGTLGLRFQFH